MQTAELTTLYDYNYWATRRILATASKLSQEQFLAETDLSWGSVREVMTHILGAEWIWRNRCQGHSPSALLDSAEFPTLDTLVERWHEEEAAMRAYVSSLTEADLAGNLTYHNTQGVAYSGRLWHILVHVVNHGTQHRAELAHVLTAYGYSPGDIDLIVYVRELGQ
ncbi:MAG: DinB family protein [Caldilineaceae bacterium]|nr:DinB family protein [Caldilineaceae bacterium]